MTWRNFGDYVWITFLDSRGAMPWKAMFWCTVAGVPAIQTHFPLDPFRHPELVSGYHATVVRYPETSSG